MADKRVEAAFHEVFTDTPKIVKHTARKFGKAKAEKQRVAIALSKARKAGASIPDKSGANFVSDNALFVPPGAQSGWKRGSEKVPYKADPPLDDSELVKPVARAQNPVEAQRQKNNQAREQRTNLGRGKPSQITVP